jgi:hypothetical protein
MPGNSAGRLTVTGTFTQSAVGALYLELAGRTAGSEYDVLDVSSAATLAGGLEVQLVNGFSPTLGDRFEVLKFASHSGDFASYSGLNVGAHLTLQHTFTPTSLLLTARPTIDGDINLDGTVNIFDINSVSANWGTAGPQGDANGDGVVNIFDINLISSNWGTSGSSAAAVPEPSSLVLSAIALFGPVGYFWSAQRRRVSMPRNSYPSDREVTKRHQAASFLLGAVSWLAGHLNCEPRRLL